MITVATSNACAEWHIKQTRCHLQGPDTGQMLGVFGAGPAAGGLP